MRDAGIGRLVAASLHQAIADLLPTRLDFYESWLHPRRLRQRPLSLAGLTAVLSFLRQEGDLYDAIVSRAGTYAAAWSVARKGRLGVRLACRLPAGLRVRAALGAARRFVSLSRPGSRAGVRWNNGAGSITVRNSVFCDIREPVVRPLCGFYLSAFSRIFRAYRISVGVSAGSCRATGDEVCAFLVGMAAPDGTEESDAAAAPRSQADPQ